ncbi:MAG: phospholipase [Acidobacteria bacterium]|nr:phospholipase [Acidobacteriota bacterium]
MKVNTGSQVTRRRFSAIAGGTLASFALGGTCHASEQQYADDGRITARPRAGVATSGTGARALGLGGTRDAILQVPAKASSPLPLLVLLHGAGGGAEGVLRRLGRVADEAGVAVLAPDSRDSSWDAIAGSFGRDVSFVNRALERVFEVVAIDPARVAVGGFSDGATYALSLGLINGDLFGRVLAFSPGFVVEGTSHGRPRFFVSHGIADTILPIDRCSRRIVRALQQRGYDVTFREFDGGHEVPSAIAREGMQWVAATGP